MASADGGAGHGEDGVDADGAHEGALSGHVGAADEEDFGFAADADVVADTLCGWDEGVTELAGDEAGRAFEEFREGGGGGVGGVGGVGRKGFDCARVVTPVTAACDRSRSPV